MTPIWKDYFVSLGANAIPFRILIDGDVVYTGKAYPRPNETSISVRINDIVADYLNADTYSVTATTQVYIYGEEEWDEVDSEDFFNDWSYDPSHSETSLSAPITGVIDSRMSSDLASKVSTPSNYTAKDTCAKYALYYLNAFGGKDAFLIEGENLVVDAYTRHTREVEYTNSSSANRGTIDYANEVVRRFTLHSGWLTDEEASRMHHLLGSTSVMLRDLETLAFYPVVITNDSCEYKTFHNQGNALVNYTIECALAQNRERR